MLFEEIIRHVYAKCIGVSYLLNFDFAPFEMAIAACVLNRSIIESTYQSSSYYEYYDPDEASVSNYDYCCWCYIVDDANVKHYKPVSRLTSNGATNAISTEDKDLKYLISCISSTKTDVSKALLETWEDLPKTTNGHSKRLFCNGVDCIYRLNIICNKRKKTSGKNVVVYKFKDTEMIQCAKAIGYTNVSSQIQTLEQESASQLHSSSLSSLVNSESVSKSFLHNQVPLVCALCLCSDDSTFAVPERHTIT